MVQSCRRLAQQESDLLGGAWLLGEELEHPQPERMRERAKLGDRRSEGGRPGLCAGGTGVGHGVS
jgi:hypothetical protein